MGIKSIRIVNLLSFNELTINNFNDINCIIGKNNAGKSNLLKLIRYFYIKLEDKRELPPSLHSAYSSYGSITIVYDTTRIRSIVTSKKTKSKFLKHIYNMLFKDEPVGALRRLFLNQRDKPSKHELTLIINSDDSTEWSISDKKVRNILSFLYPFFEVETRHIDLYDWEKVWYIISKLNTFNIDQLNQDDIINFLDMSISEDSKSYSDYVGKISKIIDTSKYSYREKVLNYIKIGLKGHTFMNAGEELSYQSDGTNSFKYIELLLTLLITLTRREYITPTIYIDEPETGLHPKKNEELISRLYEVHRSFEKTKKYWEKGKYKTPYPTIILSTHSPNVLKFVIKLFAINQQVLHFSKTRKGATEVVKMNSQFDDKKFLNIFSDNEARLFFSDFILFVEGETELELFGNLKLLDNFPALKKIDVYKNNNVTLRCTNPSYSNLSIPYLVLYDADKFISVNIPKQKINFYTNSIDLNRIYSRVKRSYCQSPHYDQKRAIETLKKAENKSFKLDSRNINFIDNELSEVIRLANNKALKPDYYMLTSTTIEGSLINRNSISLFNKWLIYEVMKSFGFRAESDIHKKIKTFQKLHKSGGNIDIIFKGLFCFDGEDMELSNDERKFVKSVKIQYLIKARNNISAQVGSIGNLLVVYRLIFRGKTDTLVSMENKAYNMEIDSSFRGMVNTIKKDYLNLFPPILGKTGGWVTRYLDFCIDKINGDKILDPNGDGFEYFFPELTDIIEVASSSIE